jgi:hypothetical protein
VASARGEVSCASDSARSSRVQHIAEVADRVAWCSWSFSIRTARSRRPAIGKLVQAKALKQGRTSLTCGAYGNVLRFFYLRTTPDAV